MSISREQAKVAFKQYSVGGPNYYVYVNDMYAGIVTRKGNRWNVQPHGGVPSETIYGTRKAAVEAIMPFIKAEAAARVHYANATSEDIERSFYQGEIYMTSKATLIEAIKAAYPDMDTKTVYDAWVNNGETIAYNVELIRREIVELHEYALELNAERDVERATVEAPTEPRERMAGFLVTSESDGSTRVTVGIMSPDIPTDKATGVTATGIPFNVFALDYTDAGRAWRMVDVLAKELREWRDPFHVAIVGTRPDKAYEGTVYGHRRNGLWEPAVIFLDDSETTSIEEPTYRAAGFPSLDAAIGASYAHR